MSPITPVRLRVPFLIRTLQSQHHHHYPHHGRWQLRQRLALRPAATRRQQRGIDRRAGAPHEDREGSGGDRVHPVAAPPPRTTTNPGRRRSTSMSSDRRSRWPHAVSPAIPHSCNLIGSETQVTGPRTPLGLGHSQGANPEDTGDPAVRPRDWDLGAWAWGGGGSAGRRGLHRRASSG